MVVDSVFRRAGSKLVRMVSAEFVFLAACASVVIGVSVLRKMMC